jgi:hypothetical protein
LAVGVSIERVEYEATRGSDVAIVKYFGTHAAAVSPLEFADELHFSVTEILTVNKAADKADYNCAGGAFTQFIP